jgi:hypothetical protein
MVESVQEQLRLLREAEAQALAEYQRFLANTPIPDRSARAQGYLTLLTEAPIKLRRAEVARKFLEDELPTACEQRL